MASSLILAVDIGNHRLKVYRVEDAPAIAAPPRLQLLQILDRAQSLEALTPQVTGHPARWVISCVQQDRGDELARWIAERKPADQVLRLSSLEIPLQIAVDTPQRVGIDRLCAATAAVTLGNGRPAVVIDAGTAITVDAVGSEGVFLGGTIALGVHGALQQLARVGSALPALEPGRLASFVTPLGTSTEQAIVSGVVLSAAGGINELVHLLQQRLGTTATVFLTGGDAGLLEPWLRFRAQRVDDLVAQGACIAGRTWLARQGQLHA